MNPNKLVLFTGDSITDCGRDRSTSPLAQLASGQPSLGDGYVQNLSDWLRNQGFEVLNTGVSGNRIYDIEARVDSDILDPKPAVVSILAGINDTWRRYDSNLVSATQEFKESYRRVLRRIREDLGARIVMVEPFLLPVPEDRRKWREDLDPKITAIRELAWEFADAYVPMDGIFAAACCGAAPSELLPDGVHPSASGHALIKESWIQAVQQRGMFNS